jgi:hypothetical protein
MISTVQNLKKLSSALYSGLVGFCAKFIFTRSKSKYSRQSTKSALKMGRFSTGLNDKQVDAADCSRDR